MTTLDLVKAATPSIIRAPWCLKGADVLSVLVESNNLEAAAASLDQHAGLRHMNVVEVCRVTRGTFEAVYARAEPKVAESDPA